MAKVTQRESPLTNPTGMTTTPHAEPGVTGPGFYQGMIGRKTGRPAPIPGGHGRTLPRHEAILAAHGLIAKGAADPNQGQLFSPSELGPAITPHEAARSAGVAPPLLSSRPGFMPGLYERKTNKGEIVPRSTAEAHKEMVKGIHRLSEFEMDDRGNAIGPNNTRSEMAERTRLPLGVAGPSLRPPVAEAMAQRQSTRALHEGDAPWYASRRETSISEQFAGKPQYELGPGSATHMISAAASRQGLSYPAMSRATAITSARTAWTIGRPGTDDYSQPNLESAENVVGNVKAAGTKITSREQAYDIGHASEGRSLGEMKGKAAVDFVTNTPVDPIHISDLSSQKVPNFNEALLLGHDDQLVRRQAAQSQTVDTHDVSSQGSHVDLLKTPAGYAVSHMLGRRTSLRNRELNPMGQSGTWMGQKSKTPEPVGQHSLFDEDRKGRIVPNRNALPTEHQTPVYDHRSDTAKRLGIEF